MIDDERMRDDKTLKTALEAGEIWRSKTTASSFLSPSKATSH